jgi:hypothetical protein
MAYAYRCADYPGMESCPGLVVAETEDEVWQLIGLHAQVAHGENPAEMTAEERSVVAGIISSVD